MALLRPQEQATATLLFRKCTPDSRISSKTKEETVSRSRMVSCLLRQGGQMRSSPYSPAYSFSPWCFSFNSRSYLSNSPNNLKYPSFAIFTPCSLIIFSSCHSSQKTLVARTSLRQTSTLPAKMRYSLWRPNMSYYSPTRQSACRWKDQEAMRGQLSPTSPARAVPVPISTATPIIIIISTHKDHRTNQHSNYQDHICHTHPSLSLFGRPLIKPIDRPHLNRGHLGALAATPEDIHALPLDLPSLLVDELIVGTQVGGELLLSQDVFVCDVELLQELGEGSLQPLVFVMRQREQLDQYALRTRLPLALCLQLSQTIQFALEFEEEFIEGKTVISVQLQINEMQGQNIQKLCSLSTFLLPLLLFEYDSLLLLQIFVISLQLGQQWYDFLEYIDKAVDDSAYLAVIPQQFLVDTHQQSSQSLPLLFIIDCWCTGE